MNSVISKMRSSPKKLAVAIVGALAVSAAGVAQAAAVISSFEGISQYDNATLLRNFIPPDTMGAVGTTQYLEVSNGSVAVYNKVSHAQTQLITDLAFWAAAGQTGANGDTRVLFDHVNQRWIATSLGASLADIQIAVSTGPDATGPWKSTKFTGFAGGIADFPTLGMNANGIYIGTNNFNANNTFAGVSLFTIPKSDLYAAVPSTINITRFDQIGTNTTDPNKRGLTFQGVVNNSAIGGNEVILANDRFSNPSLAFDKFSVLNPGAPGATLSATTVVNIPAYLANTKGHQPDGTVVMDTGDNRISSNAYQVGNKIYLVHTEGGTGISAGHTVVHYFVLDATSGAILDQGKIEDATHDFFMGSIAANAFGQVVIGYNRVGAALGDNASFLASAFVTGVGGLLVDTNDFLIKAGLVGDYHCYVHNTPPNGCRERWGDYSSVTLDPTDPFSFWAIGEFTREYNDAAGGHQNGTGGSRWGTWIAQIRFDAPGRVPEPETLALLTLGLLGMAAMRKRKS